MVEPESETTSSGVVILGPATCEYPHLSQSKTGPSFWGLYLSRVPHFGQNFIETNYLKRQIIGTTGKQDDL